MPLKKGSKASPSATRGRSKSAGRTPSKGRSRTQRSRSRSRVSTKKTTRTPASETKIRRRRSSSSSSREVQVTRTTRKSEIDASGDKRQGIATLQRESIPSRFSQRIIEKIETTRPNHSACNKLTARTEKPSVSKLQKLSNLFRDRFCPSPITACLSMVLSIGSLFWLNFMVFSPSSDFFGKPKVQISKWGAGYQFLGVVWPSNWRVYFNVPSASFVMGYIVISFMLARFFPIGQLILSRNESRHPDYRCNGVIAALFFSSVFGALQYGVLKDFGIMKLSSYIVKYWIGLLTSTSVLVVLSAIIVTCTVKRVPRGQICKEGNTGNFLVDMQNGRWVRPRWFGLDWKMFVLRTSMLGVALVDICFGFVQWENYRRVSPALAATVVMELIQVMDYLIFERASLSWDLVRRDGFGFSTVFTICWSLFVRSIPSCYLSTKPDVGRLTTAGGEVHTGNVALLSSAALLFLVGYWIYFNSNRQKSLFCRQPNHSSFSGMPKVAGLHSQSILAGGWWGVVRHPNYLGNILMVMAMALTTGCSSVIPWIYPSAVVVMLLHRLICMEHANLEEFGLAYEMYKKLVPYRLLPKLF